SESGDGTKRPRSAAMTLSDIKGHQAIIATCDVCNAARATKELINLLNDFADRIYPKTKCEFSNDVEETSPNVAAGMGDTAVNRPGELSVEDLVRHEAEALRSRSGETGRFVSVNTGVKGVIAICVMRSEIDIVVLVASIFSDIRRTKERKSRFLQRVIPLHVTSYAEVESLKCAAKPLVESAFRPVRNNGGILSQQTTMPMSAKNATIIEESGSVDGDDKGSMGRERGDVESGGSSEPMVGGEIMNEGECSKGITFRVDVNKRNSSLKRTDLITALVAFVGKGHQVDLKNAEVVIMVEAVRSMVGISILKDYMENCEYNMHKLQDLTCKAVLET
ncbi:unnamed protein product, partial [Choristocarpus tenellus]